MKNLLIWLVLLTFASCANVFAQDGETGKLNAWTSAAVARRRKVPRKTPYLREIRAAKNEGFDRIVFEFTGEVPRYYIEYVEAPIYGTADEEIKVGGKFFLLVTLHGLPYPEPEEKELGKVRILDNTPNLRVIEEIVELEWFEGDRPHVVGLKAKKLFRVRQLKNPARLVIDFKH